MYRQAYYDTISEVKWQFDKSIVAFANGTVDPWLSGTGTSITNDCFIRVF